MGFDVELSRHRQARAPSEKVLRKGGGTHGREMEMRGVRDCGGWQRGTQVDERSFEAAKV